LYPAIIGRRFISILRAKRPQRGRLSTAEGTGQAGGKTSPATCVIAAHLCVKLHCKNPAENAWFWSRQASARGCRSNAHQRPATFAKLATPA